MDCLIDRQKELENDLWLFPRHESFNGRSRSFSVLGCSILLANILGLLPAPLMHSQVMSIGLVNIIS